MYINHVYKQYNSQQSLCVGGKIHLCMDKVKRANVLILCLLLKYLYCTCIKVKQLETTYWIFNISYWLLEIRKQSIN